MEYLSLKKFIGLAEKKCNMRICIHDISGTLRSDLLKIDEANRIHSCAFCNAAKKNKKGYNLCIRSKTAANKKAVMCGEMFSGYCPYGLYEVVKPVIVNGNTVCIIYIGNLVMDKNESLKRMLKASQNTGADADELEKQLNNSEFVYDLSLYEEYALAIDSYIRFLINAEDLNRTSDGESGCKWKVSELARYIEKNYDKNISLKQAAKLYFVNNKYIGRVFKIEFGMTFHQYLNSVRLSHAEEELKNTQKSVIEISLDCGFMNVSYFNRQFMKKNGMTPTDFRKNSNKIATKF